MVALNAATEKGAQSGSHSPASLKASPAPA